MNIRALLRPACWLLDHVFETRSENRWSRCAKYVHSCRRCGVEGIA